MGPLEFGRLEEDLLAVDRCPCVAFARDGSLVCGACSHLREVPE